MSSGTDSKIALVTGAAMGIGSAIAEHLARDGLTILVSDLDFDEADKTARRFRETGYRPNPCNSTLDNRPRSTPPSAR